MNEITKGPWKVYGDADGIWVINPLAKKDLQTICLLCNNSLTKDRAETISLVPDMIEALEMIEEITRSGLSKVAIENTVRIGNINAIAKLVLLKLRRRK